ncbi:MAG: heparinase II/III family protein, partial [Candidatus Latescibacteria bacterium]|nr:heparinase II/III family protein [Candidatus Latescibacterota bacterium]
DARWLFFKVSPHGSAHHHRDTLGIQIWAGGHKLLIEPYVGDYAFERDVYNRSWWHSTPTLGAELLPLDPQPEVLHWEAGDELEYAAGQIRIPVSEDAETITIRRHVFFVDRSWWALWDEFADLPDGQVVWENFHLVTRQLRIDDSGSLVMTALADGPNLLMHVGTPGWKVSAEETRMWPVYGHDTEPTATLHYAGDATAVERGFAALFAVVDGSDSPPETAFERVERLEDGRVRLEVSVAGSRKTLTTQVVPQE